jgi:DNA ligase D-like protein (predicted 3'-phosphoesterase)
MKFSVQEHHATHLHWDLRLECDGVLKSWAVPKGISLVPGERRLAVPQPDHELGYLRFEGEIGDGYGAGRVSLWDVGTYTCPSWKERKIVVHFKGKKLRGKYVLVRIKDGNWIIFKGKST